MWGYASKQACAAQLSLELLSHLGEALFTCGYRASKTKHSITLELALSSYVASVEKGK